ncbi:Por secretion system C-terminal sorting domain-containing protein [Catalinimonas alkaloidigena]|uniref:Por secretion system C-terminal sorting domain-containing protein n=1 Tax=Catalinimonas alkaloidigena TaxID=1075417 RepID=A0A1G9T4V6_9BACT|nr:alpha-amylase family glycosyl hydrolase [Catalinimonas alkaloidigena]SDM42662.1 Por secretion system C-terminal sorting domain-containing protein [Catalinimonas alkaloidigena]
MLPPRLLRFACWAVLLLWSAGSLRAQVTSDPAFPTADAPVTILYDATQGTSGLVGATKVYMHAGAGTQENGAGAGYDFQPEGQAWGQDNGVGLMTQDAENPNLWRITITPRTYFGVPDSTRIWKLGLVFRNADGSKEGKDPNNQNIYLTIYDTELSVQFESPTAELVLPEAGSTLPISVVSSESAQLTLYQNETQLAQTTGTALTYELSVGASGEGWIKVVGQTATATQADSFRYVVRAATVVAPLPEGVVDGINYRSTTSVVLSLYAPEKSFAYLLSDLSDWQISIDYALNQTPGGDHFWIQLDDLTPGQEYGFQYFVDGAVRVGDPYAEKILDEANDPFIPAETYPNLKPYPTGQTTGTVAVFQTDAPAYAWQTTDFVRPEADDLVIYELLVRDFVDAHDYRTIIDSLSYLKTLGINALELMPVQEFAGNLSWGYNPIYYFAPDKYYGAKNDLKALIDSAHAQGMAVILDLVLNHADYENPFVKLYWDGTRPAANNPWLNPEATHPFSVFFDFNHESVATQAFVDRVNAFWLEEYHVDGFRYDLSKGFTQRQTSDVDAWSQYDASRVAILERMYDQLRTVDASAYVILEHFGSPQEEQELGAYGMMLWNKMTDPYNQNTMGYVENASLAGASYLTHGWTDPDGVTFMESHDEERLMFKNLAYGNASGDYNVKDLPTALDRVKAAAVFFFPIPGPKMVWQFGELGYEYSINACEDGSINNGCRTNPKPIRWDYLQEPERYELYQTFAALIDLKTHYSVFSTDDFTLVEDGLKKRLHLSDSTMHVTIVGNFDVTTAELSPAFQQTGTWYDFFAADSITVTDTAAALTLRPGEFKLYTSEKLPAPPAGLAPYGPVTATPGSLAQGAPLRLYPNPSAGQLTVEAAQALTHLTVRDVLGRVVQEQDVTGSQVSLQVGSLPSGLYIVEATTRQGKHIARFVKQ